VTHVYAAPGAYRATATVTDDLGVATAASVDVLVRGVQAAVRPGRVRVGGRVAVAGTVVPPAADVEVRVEQRRRGAWHALATVGTAADGAFAARVALATGGPLRAVALAPDAPSAELPVEVAPVVQLHAGPAVAFVDGRVRARIRPARADGPAVLTILRGGQPVATVRARIRGGVLSTRVPAPGVGVLGVRLDVPARNGLAAASATAVLRPRARPLSLGASGRDVAGLLRRLAELGVHTPGAGPGFSAPVFDAVLAFQKAVGLPRTGSVGPATWSRLTTSEPIRPHFRSPANRIEVDKTRQILVKVVGDRVVGVLPVSTGATGNTPEGRWHIRWKAPATGTWLGSAVLYRTLTFWGNSFAIHGFPSVPAYPASHGCVRIPIWAADWLYVRSPVGEAVYVYRS
jgi:lipoprotein-anchoring transpeptidase ErfK/SrfK